MYPTELLRLFETGQSQVRMSCLARVRFDWFVGRIQHCCWIALSVCPPGRMSIPCAGEECRQGLITAQPYYKKPVLQPFGDSPSINAAPLPTPSSEQKRCPPTTPRSTKDTAQQPAWTHGTPQVAPAHTYKYRFATLAPFTPLFIRDRIEGASRMRR